MIRTALRSRSHVLLLLLHGLSFTPFAFSQELEPLSYTNAPVGLKVFGVGAGYSEGAVLPDPSVPIEDAFIKNSTSILAFVNTFGIWGKSSRIGFVLPYAQLNGSGKLFGEQRVRKVSGFADPAMKIQINFFGAPALTLPEFGKYKQDVIVGFSLTTIAPWGQYDSERLANIGTNRWTFKPELGISKSIGPWTLELAQAAKLLTDNDRYYGGQYRKQDPFLATQVHAIYRFRPGRWISFDATHYSGGRTTIDGVRKNDRQSNWRYGLTYSMAIDQRNSIKLYASTGVSTRFGNDFDLFGLLWQHTWR